MAYSVTPNDQIYVVPYSNGALGPIQQPTTAGAIAALAAAEGVFLVSQVTANAGTTLTGAQLLGDQIVRTGPTAAFTDTTDTAANIVAAFPGGAAQGSSNLLYKNATAYYVTLAAGTGVTLPGTVIIPPFCESNYIFVPTSATTVTVYHGGTVPLAVGQRLSALAPTSLATVGAGTITAANFASGATARTGSTSAFTDTTDAATAIVAACADLVNKVGASTIYWYFNNTVAVATITGGTGVTVSGITTVAANSWAMYIVTQTAANTLTMVGVAQGYYPAVGTFTANGATAVTVANTAVTAGSNITFTLKTVGGTPAGAPFLSASTPGTSFAVKAAAGDTSVYNYEIRG